MKQDFYSQTALHKQVHHINLWQTELLSKSLL